MKKYIVGLVLGSMLASVLATSSAGMVAGQTGPNFGLPTLNVINQATLSPSYSCQPGVDPLTYNNTALFLSAYSKQQNEPDLLFDGACGGVDDFEASTAGDDMALIADLGAGVDLSKVSAQLAFNLKDIAAFADYSQFAMSVRVRKGHTYAVLINKSDVRGLFVFTVINHVQNKEVELEYAVNEYQVMNVVTASPGFDWQKGNQ